MIKDHARHHLPGFIVQVLATTVGLLLALGLDQWRDHRRQSALSRIQLTAIEEELKTNLAEVDLESKSIDGLDRQLATLIAQLRASHGLLDNRISLHIASLRESAWSMTLSSQVALHTYPERMAQLADAYESVRMLKGLQDRLVEQLDIISDLDSISRQGTLPTEARLDLLRRTQALRARLNLIRNILPSIRESLATPLLRATR